MEENVHLIDLSTPNREVCFETLRLLLRSKLLDEKMKKLVRQNKGGTFYLSNAGHEMVGTLAALHLTPGKDWALPYYRDRAFALGYGTTSKEILTASLGRAGAHHSGGRMMPDHFSDKQKRLVCQSSIVGSQFLHAVGIAKSIQLKQKDEIVYVSAGDGATSQGDFHEALNFAAIHCLPILFVIQNNDWAISVPAHEQTAGGDFTRGISSMPGLSVRTVDGCDFEEVSQVFQEASASIREGKGPVVVNAKIPRLSGHSNSDDPRKYLAPSEMEGIQKKDPVPRYKQWLIDERMMTEEEIEALHEELEQEIEEATREAENVPAPHPETVKDHVFKDSQPPEFGKIFSKQKEEAVIIDAINHGLDEEMARSDDVVVFGQDVAHGKGGVFGATRFLTDKYGERCFNTPLAESTIIGLAAGMSMAYHLPVAEIQFADYCWTGMNQLVNELASIHYRSNGEWSCPVVIRMPSGGYIQGGPYHSQNIEAHFTHTPGLKVVYPSNAEDAKRLLKTAIHDPNPVIFFEHKAIYRQRIFSARIEPGDEEFAPIGPAHVVREGSDLTVISYGMMTVYASELAQSLSREGISVEVIDLPSLSPLDMETILTSVKKTGKVLVVHEASRTCGFGAEIVARIAGEAFEYLDAPIRRVTGEDCPISYAKELETAALPQKEELMRVMQELVSF